MRTVSRMMLLLICVNIYESIYIYEWHGSLVFPVKFVGALSVSLNFGEPVEVCKNGKVPFYRRL